VTRADECCQRALATGNRVAAKMCWGLPPAFDSWATSFGPLTGKVAPLRLFRIPYQEAGGREDGVK